MAEDAGGKEVGRISIRVVPNLKQFWSDLKAAVEEVERTLEAKIKVVPDMDGFREKVRAETANLPDAKVEVKTDLDGFQKRMLAELSKASKSLEAKIPLTADGERLRREAALRVAEIEHSIRAKIPVHLEMAAGQRAKIAAEVAGLSALGAIERKGINGFADVANTIGEVGGNALSALSNVRAFGIGLAGLVAIASLVAPGLALVSGILVTLPGLFAAITAPVAALVLGFGGIKKALDDSGFMNLVEGKTNKKGVKTGKDKQEPGQVIKEAQKEISEIFATGLTPVFSDLANKVVPPLTQALKPVASGLVDIVSQFSGMISNGPGLANLQNIFTNMGSTLSNMAPGIAKFGEGLLNLADKTVAKFPHLGEQFTQMGDKFTGWVDKIMQPNAQGVSQFDTAMHNLKGTLGEISGLIGDIFHWSWGNLGDKGFGDSMKNFASDLRNLIDGTLPGLVAAFKGVGEVLKPISDTLNAVNKAGSWIGKIAGAFNNPEDNVPFDKASIGEKLAGGLGANFENQLKNWWNGNEDLPTATSAGKQAAESYLGGIDKSLQAQKDKLSSDQLLLPAQDQVGAKPDGGAAAQDFRKQFLDGINGLGAQAVASLSSLSGMISAAVAQAAAPLNALSTQIISTFAGIGPLIVAGWSTVIPAIVGGMSQVGTAITAQLAQIPTAIGNTFNSLAGVATAGLSTLVNVVAGIGGQIVGVISSWSGLFAAALQPVAASFTEAGVNSIQGYINGLNAGLPNAITAASNAGAQIHQAFNDALGIHSPSRRFAESGQYSAQGFQEGLEGGFQGVIERATSLAKQVSDAMQDGMVSPQLKAGLKQEMKELQLEYQSLKVQKDQAGETGSKGPIGQQMKQVQALKDQLKLQSDQLGYSSKYGGGQGDSTNEAAQMITKALAGMLDTVKSFASANIKQFESDIGISGNGAIPQIADIGIGWATQQLGQMVNGAFGVGQTNIHVNSIDEGLAAKRNIDNRKALQWDR